MLVKSKSSEWKQGTVSKTWLHYISDLRYDASIICYSDKYDWHIWSEDYMELDHGTSDSLYLAKQQVYKRL